eukprot:1488393-Prymnesium_polylepis.1
MLARPQGGLLLVGDGWIDHAFIRLYIGMIVSSAYLIVLLVVRPVCERSCGAIAAYRKTAHIRLPPSAENAMLLLQYKRGDVGVMAFSAQTSVVFVFYTSLCIHQYKALQDVGINLSSRILGFHSLDQLVAMMVAIVLIFIVVFVAFTVHQAFTSQNLQLLRLADSSQSPDLTLNHNKWFHLFLSHIWSSGQVGCAQHERDVRLACVSQPG